MVLEIALAVGGALLSPAFQLLLGKLTSKDLLNYARQGPVLDELNKWERMLKKIYTVLDDAEEKQVSNKAVKIWVSELRDLAYEVDDILDEFDFEALRMKLIMDPTPSSSSNMTRLIPSRCVLSRTIESSQKKRTTKFNAEMISRMERVTVKLDNIAKEKDVLHLVEGARRRVSQVGEQPAATSLVNEARVHGREKDKMAIIQLLQAESTCAEISVIPIVGMGGMGKTTLAQLVFNDTTVKFDFKAWVYVGEDFNVSRITKTILPSKDCDGDDLNSLQVKLKEKLSRNKFLIVLDDVWTENYDDWTLFRAPFEAGAPGSRIVITTRSERVSSKIGIAPPYYLQRLSYDAMLSIFINHALGRINFDEHLDLEEIGRAIAKKCQGLPLAAKTLGGVLRGKPCPNIWIEVLRNKIWDIPEDSGGILPSLWLSYHHLPSHLKGCFAHCAVLPKDFSFHRHDLVLLWMAEGLLPQSKTKKKMEDIGLEYFNELLSRSFFEQCGDGMFVMHDLISDLAHFVAGETYLDSLDDLGCRQRSADYDKVRHLTHIDWTEEKLEVLCKIKHLRTMIVRRYGRGGFSGVMLNALIPELKCLRVLKLDNANITQLPNSICQLKHLRYLCLSHTGIKRLPESVGELLHLQTLILNECKDLIALPQGIKNLTDLHYLNVASTLSLQEMPAGLGNLINLQQLSKFIVAKCDGLRVHELKDLSELQGELSIQGLHSVVDIKDAKAASLKDKHGLDSLEMKWCDKFNDSRNKTDGTLVLDALQPPKNLKMLTIAFFGGSKFPMWLGDRSYLKLVQLDLVSCRNSTSLPSLGRLPFLRKLSIEGAGGVRSVGAEFYGHDLASPSSFQSLEILRFENMLNWEHWTCSEINFPCLVQFELQNCPKLIGELPQQLPSVEHLHIVACPKLKDSLRSLSSLHTLYTEHCNQAIFGRVISFCSLTSLQLFRISDLAFLNIRLMQAVTALKILKVEDCSKLSFLWEDGAEVQMLASLKRLVVCKCPNLYLFATGDQGMPCNLKFLVLEECKNLKTLPNNLHTLTALMDLRIKRCPKLNFPATGLPKTLTYLRFGDIHEKDEDQDIMRREELCQTSNVAYHSFAASTYQPSQEEGKMRICVSDLWQLESLLQSMVCNNIKHIFVRACLKCLGEFKHNLIDLRGLAIGGCVSRQRPIALPEWGLSYLKYLGEFKHNLVHLRGLTIAGCLSKQRPIALSEWGLSCLTSLRRLDIFRIPMVSFPDDDGHLLPTSLKHVSISCINNLESISKGILTLTSLELLQISSCYKLSSLPKEGLPVSLQRLDISYCDRLEQRCEREKGDYWPIISNIPERHIYKSYNDPNNACVIP